jgi:hypothetical protein
MVIIKRTFDADSNQLKKCRKKVIGRKLLHTVLKVRNPFFTVTFPLITFFTDSKSASNSAFLNNHIAFLIIFFHISKLYTNMHVVNITNSDSELNFSPNNLSVFSS